MAIQREDGIALIVALLAMLLMSALGLVLVMTTSAETIIAANFRNGREGLYAVDAALERAIDDLPTTANWNGPVDGSITSAFVDGPPGYRRLPDGSSVDLVQALNLVNCQKATTCSASELSARTVQRPWGVNNPVWQLYAYGPLSALLPPNSISSSYYVIVMIADDPSENDGNPLLDGNSPTNPGTGVLTLRAEAFGPRGTHRVGEMTVTRNAGGPGVRILSWREIR